ncbi:MAG: winged helix-turn-helix transcriptional regulator [Saprospiraceae bacterium]|nr:winged helix-turn-helix transcriptional regulator [Saprospiraceae bacterium]MBK8779178.1 winged helix-turn-helix transcriptional regulator [Saprospiraceae bacterium]MBP7803010.1 winged helix-turn-helix transcriptional regulator [Saprospiraceae bacterium]MBP8094683.1 winged helix-turn-helix transcriptional regulator [Saprospiraceae bacterium]
MAYSKKEKFGTKEQSLAAFAKALAHPARIAILSQLCKKEGCQCGEIVDMLPLSQSTVSQHLKELKSAGLVSGEVDGPRSCYCINWAVIEKCYHDFNTLFSTLKTEQQKCCC